MSQTIWGRPSDHKQRLTYDSPRCSSLATIASDEHLHYDVIHRQPEIERERESSEILVKISKFLTWYLLPRPQI